MPLTRIAAITPRRIMLAIAEMVIQLTFQGALDHHLGQLPQQPALTGQLQPAGAGPLGKLPQQLLISGRQPHRPGSRWPSHQSLVSPPSLELHR